jgi:hypothetical protein
MSDQELRNPHVENPPSVAPSEASAEDLIRMDDGTRSGDEQVADSDSGRRSRRRSVSDTVGGFFRAIGDRISRSPSPDQNPPPADPQAPQAPLLQPSRPAGAQNVQEAAQEEVRPSRSSASVPRTRPISRYTQTAALQPAPIMRPARSPQRSSRPPSAAGHSDYYSGPERRRSRIPGRRSATDYTTTDDSGDEGRTILYQPRYCSGSSRRRSPSRTATETEQSSADITDDEFPKHPKGATRIARALHSGSYMALRTDKYDDRTRRKAASKMTRGVAQSSIRAAIGEEDIRIASESLQPQYATKLEKLSSKMKKREDLKADDYEKIKKALKREFPNRFTNNYDLINAFLENFVETVNLHKPSEEQAKKLLLSYFNDSMRTTIRNQINLGSLQGAIDYLRKHKANAGTIEKYQAEAKNWKLDRTKDIKPQLMELHELHSNANPSEPLQMVYCAVMAQLRMFLTDAELKALQTEQAEKKARRSGMGMTFEEVVRFLEGKVEIKPKKDKKERDVNSVSARRNASPPPQYQETTRQIYAQSFRTATVDPLPPPQHPAPQRSFYPAPPEAPLPQQSYGQERYRSYAPPAEQSDARGNTYSYKIQEPPRVPFEDMVFLKQNHPEFPAISQNFSKKQLEERTAQSNEIAFITLSDGSIVPVEGLEIKPYSRRLAIFYRNPRTRRVELTRALLNHFEGKCSTCGLPGHRNADKVCPFQNAADSWGICNRCRRGMHLTVDCKYNADYLAKNEERQSEHPQAR